ncbi:MAG: hypothetical protein H7836_13595 [Magnetococcus sp. YQC-3]
MKTPPSNDRFGLILAVILLVYGMGFLILAGPLLYSGPSVRWYVAGQAVGSMLFTLFLGVATSGIVWIVKRYLMRTQAPNWRKAVLWGTGFWAVTTLLYRLSILLGHHQLPLEL